MDNEDHKIIKNGIIPNPLLEPFFKPLEDIKMESLKADILGSNKENSESECFFGEKGIVPNISDNEEKLPAYRYYCLHMIEESLDVLTEEEFEEEKEHWCDVMSILFLTKENEDPEVYVCGDWCTMLLVKKKIQRDEISISHKGEEINAQKMVGPTNKNIR